MKLIDKNGKLFGIHARCRAQLFGAGRSFTRGFRVCKGGGGGNASARKAGLGDVFPLFGYGRNRGSGSHRAHFRRVAPEQFSAFAGGVFRILFLRYALAGFFRKRFEKSTRRLCFTGTPFRKNRRTDR